MSNSHRADCIPRAQQVQTVAAMYVGYAMFMVLRMVPTVAGVSIREDPVLGIDTGEWGRILAMGTVGAVVGKFVGGFAADAIGGKWTFTIGLVVSLIGVAIFAASSTVWMFQASLFVALMAKSAGWPSMTKIIVNWFRPGEYGRVWGVLATSSRVGTLTATFCLGGLLAFISWQTMLLTAAAAGVIVAIYFAFGLQDRPVSRETECGAEESRVGPTSQDAHPHPLDDARLDQALLCFCCSGQFWLITLSLMCLTIMWDFLLMVPLYLQDTLQLSAANASMASSAFPFGSLISVLVGGYVFDKLNRRGTAWVMGLMLAMASSCILVFLLMPQFALSTKAMTWLSLFLLFNFGLCVSPCYYIPMSVFSIEFGGPRSGFLIALLDAIAFGATAAFYYFAGELAERSWSLFLGAMLAIAVCSMLATFLFMLGESKRQSASLSFDQN